ncbi:phage minor capsid protein [Oceanobacillus sp. CF4.6]|uniref:phage minor capsid protein n=1 Tax=Oceanobacillus sp. CF4.6 TaxID=3373080 RepID=UPI003EE58C63
MDKETLQKFSKPVSDVYLSIEDQLLTNIAKKLAKDNSLLVDIEKDGDIQKIQSWQLNQLGQLDSLSEENIKTIAKKSGVAVEEIEKMVTGVGYKSVNEIEGVMKEGAEKGVLLTPPEGAKDSGALKNILSAYEQQAKSSLNLTNTTLIEQSKQKYLDVINQTTGKVLSGVTSAQQAQREAIRELANGGVPALIDRSGREWNTEAYVNMVMRSTSNNVAKEMQDGRMDEYGVDLVEVSSHAGARPGCEPYQGKIYSRSGESNKYPPLSETSMGDADGLFGVHCGHVQYPYIEGISKKTYEPGNKKENDKVYEQSQKQRLLERNVRSSKRELAMMMQIGDAYGINDAEERLKDKQANMRAFINDTGRTRKISREQIR